MGKAVMARATQIQRHRPAARQKLPTSSITIPKRASRMPAQIFGTMRLAGIRFKSAYA